MRRMFSENQIEKMIEEGQKSPKFELVHEEDLEVSDEDDAIYLPLNVINQYMNGELVAFKISYSGDILYSCVCSIFNSSLCYNSIDDTTASFTMNDEGILCIDGSFLAETRTINIKVYVLK